MIIRLIREILSWQNPEDPHSPLTTTRVSGLILFVNLVLYGFYGVLAAVVVYLVVEWFGLSPGWMFAPMLVSVVIGLRKAAFAVQDYWSNYGQ